MSIKKGNVEKKNCFHLDRMAAKGFPSVYQSYWYSGIPIITYRTVTVKKKYKFQISYIPYIVLSVSGYERYRNCMPLKTIILCIAKVNLQTFV